MYDIGRIVNLARRVKIGVGLTISSAKNEVELMRVPIRKK